METATINNDSSVNSNNQIFHTGDIVRYNRRTLIIHHIDDMGIWFYGTDVTEPVHPSQCELLAKNQTARP